MSRHHIHAMDTTASNDADSEIIGDGPPAHHHRKAPFGRLEPHAQDVEDLVDAAVSSFWKQDPAIYEGPLSLICQMLKHWDGCWKRDSYMVRPPAA